MNIWETSVIIAVMIGAILVFRKIGKKRISKGTIMALWNLVLLKALVPWRIPVSGHSILEDGVQKFSLQNRIPKMTGAWEKVSDSTRIAGEMMRGEQIQSADILPWIWAVGAASLLLYFVLIFGREYQALKSSKPMQNNMIERMIHTCGLRRKIRLYRGRAFETPVTYGVLFPKIVLPVECPGMSRVDMRNVVDHELEHIRRFDVGKKYLMIATLCVHWFNPFVWLMYRTYQEDLEMACDERVMRKLGKEKADGYIYTLIKMATEKKRLFGTTAGFGGKHTGKNRILQALNRKKTGMVSFTAAGLFGICLLSSFLSFSQEGKHMNEPAAVNMEEAGASDFIPELVEPRFDGTSHMMPYDEDFDYNAIMQDIMENYNDFSQPPTEEQVKAVSMKELAVLAGVYKERQAKGQSLEPEEIWVLEEYGHMADLVR